MALQGTIRVDERSQRVRANNVEIVLDDSAAAAGPELRGTSIKETISMKDGILVTSSTVRTPDGTTTVTTTTTNTNDGSQTTTTTTTDSSGNSSTTVEIKKK